MIKENEQKKEYIAPKMEVIDMDHDTPLLGESSVDQEKEMNAIFTGK